MAMRETVAHDAAVRKVNTCAVADQEMLPMAVADQEVFLVAVAAQEIVAAQRPCRRCPHAPTPTVNIFKE